MGKFFDDLKEGLEKVLVHIQDKITFKSEIIEIPDAPNEYKAEDIKRIREKCHYSQNIFAKILNVSPRIFPSVNQDQNNSIEIFIEFFYYNSFF